MSIELAIKEIKKFDKKLKKNLSFDVALKEEFDKEEKAYLTSIYYYGKSFDFFYNCFEKNYKLELKVSNNPIKVFYFEEYLIIDSLDEIDFDLFSEICYNTLVAIGFISGKFIQNCNFTFQYSDKLRTEMLGFEYCQLRSSSFSIYHTLTNNPYGYKYLIGQKLADAFYIDSLFKSIEDDVLSKLIELTMFNSQIQYALVLFNDAKNGKLSLLIHNNCYFVVLEVLRKFFAEYYKDCLPRGFKLLWHKIVSFD